MSLGSFTTLEAHCAKVRQALKMCQDRERILQLAYFGEGDLSIDAHMAPVHPAYCEKPIPEYDPDCAKALLEGIQKGQSLEIQLGVQFVYLVELARLPFLFDGGGVAQPHVLELARQLVFPAGHPQRLGLPDDLFPVSFCSFTLSLSLI